MRGVQPRRCRPVAESRWPRWWAAARPPFLLLTPAVVALGGVTAHLSGGHGSWSLLLGVMLTALCAHISVNAFNEAADFANGLDAQTQRTPFSGGSGVLPAHPNLLPAVRALAWLSLIVVLLGGLALVVWRGWPLLVLGLSGVLVLLAYSGHLVRSPWGSLLAPGWAFGPVMVVGTHLAMGAPLNALACVASLLPFCSVNNLLLLNQLPDVVADRAVGRRNWPIVHGLRASLWAYAVLALSMPVVAALAVASGLWPPSVWVLLLAWWPLPWVAWRLRALGDAPVPSHATLAANVWVALATPAALAWGLAIGH